MRKLNLEISLEGVTIGGEEKDKLPQEIALLVIQNNILVSWVNSRKGLLEEERRQYYKLLDAIEGAEKEKSPTISLEDTQYELLAKAKREATLMPHKLLQRVEYIIDNPLEGEKAKVPPRTPPRPQ